MKQQDYVGTTLSTHIADILAIGNQRSDEHLRLVPGGAQSRTRILTDCPPDRGGWGCDFSRD